MKLYPESSESCLCNTLTCIFENVKTLTCIFKPENE